MTFRLVALQMLADNALALGKLNEAAWATLRSFRREVDACPWLQGN